MFSRTTYAPAQSCYPLRYHPMKYVFLYNHWICDHDHTWPYPPPSFWRTVIALGFFLAPFLNNPVNSYVIKQILLSFGQILSFREGVEKIRLNLWSWSYLAIDIFDGQNQFQEIGGRSKIFTATNLEINMKLGLLSEDKFVLGLHRATQLGLEPWTKT